ncbi:hypothetical protein HYPSUDRAFT_47171 [Hypholoma sublateritium FD-334 SS-4]|uniref:Uncharacterized protein n=1 Tax=Hypholoma sublateritium (strain FD-334 SS-4) TaxID=945553 RepID=A0A0D2M0E3_HYPSF|nr:hypothetical protein HYPSUDRAFT_47171 [Hypholoma sublateritium FD-334 SS-4]
MWPTTHLRLAPLAASPGPNPPSLPMKMMTTGESTELKSLAGPHRVDHSAPAANKPFVFSTNTTSTSPEPVSSPRWRAEAQQLSHHLNWTVFLESKHSTPTLSSHLSIALLVTLL